MVVKGDQQIPRVKRGRLLKDRISNKGHRQISYFEVLF